MTKKLHLRLKPNPINIAALVFAVGSSAVQASTALERRIVQEAAPHTTVTKSNPKVTAHFATVSGYFEGQPRNAERVAKLKADLDSCVQIWSGLGTPITRPTEWPDHLAGSRTDTYTTERYAITYSQNSTYGGYAVGCSLIEQYSRMAALESSAGRCTIDLIEKTAWGQCDMAAHRRAKPLPLLLPEAGPLQVIAGLRCGVRNIVGTDHCIAVDGKMKPSYALVISRWSDYGFHYKATAAALDMEVSESLFAPHLQGGFSVTAKQP